MGRPVQSNARRAFTLIELVISLGLISIIMGLLLPALSGARAEARAVRSLAQVRQAATLLHAYAGDHREEYPLVAKTALPAARDWYRPLVENGLVASVHELDPEGMRTARPTVTIALSHTLVAHTDEFTPPGRGLQRWELPTSIVRIADVTFPSEKGELYRWWVVTPTYEGQWCCAPFRVNGPVVRVDGSGFRAGWLEFEVEPALNPDLGLGYPVWSTWNGFRGRDRISK